MYFPYRILNFLQNQLLVFFDNKQIIHFAVLLKLSELYGGGDDDDVYCGNLDIDYFTEGR